MHHAPLYPVDPTERATADRHDCSLLEQPARERETENRRAREMIDCAFQLGQTTRPGHLRSRGCDPRQPTTLREGSVLKPPPRHNLELAIPCSVSRHYEDGRQQLGKMHASKFHAARDSMPFAHSSRASGLVLSRPKRAEWSVNPLRLRLGAAKRSADFEDAVLCPLKQCVPFRCKGRCCFSPPSTGLGLSHPK